MIDHLTKVGNVSHHLTKFSKHMRPVDRRNGFKANLYIFTYIYKSSWLVQYLCKISFYIQAKRVHRGLVTSRTCEYKQNLCTCRLKRFIGLRPGQAQNQDKSAVINNTRQILAKFYRQSREFRTRLRRPLRWCCPGPHWSACCPTPSRSPSACRSKCSRCLTNFKTFSELTLCSSWVFPHTYWSTMKPVPAPREWNYALTFSPYSKPPSTIIIEQTSREKIIWHWTHDSWNIWQPS